MHKHTQNHKTERQCEIDGCGKKHLAKGYCRQHYRAIANPDKPRLVTVSCIDCGASAEKHHSAKDFDRCHTCAMSIAAKRGNTGRARKHWPSSRVFAGICKGCSGAFVKQSTWTYCTDECASEYRSKKNARTGTCRKCLVSSTAKGRYYCDPCRDARDTETRRAEKKRNRHKRGSNHRQRARIFNVYYEPVNPMQVFARDHWVCQLCGHNIDPDLKWPAPRSRSLDHVVPMSMGGPHTYGNTQLACLECNTNKGATLTP